MRVTKFTFFLLLFSIFLNGCGGGSGDNLEPSFTQSYQVTVNIEGMGASSANYSVL